MDCPTCVRQMSKPKERFSVADIFDNRAILAMVVLLIALYVLQLMYNKCVYRGGLNVINTSMR